MLGVLRAPEQQGGSGALWLRDLGAYRFIGVPVRISGLCALGYGSASNSEAHVSWLVEGRNRINKTLAFVKALNREDRTPIEPPQKKVV